MFNSFNINYHHYHYHHRHLHYLIGENRIFVSSFCATFLNLVKVYF